MSKITTYTGKHFDPVTPEENLIDIRDIAHALSLLCRGNGHVTHFYSVAQHCIAVAKEAKMRGYDEKIQLAGLLHDGAEAYMSDMTRPLKKEMPKFSQLEEILLEKIWRQFIGDISLEEQKIIFEIDDDMLSYEFMKIMPETISDRYLYILTKPSIKFENFENVEKEYLELFYKLMDKCKK